MEEKRLIDANALIQNHGNDVTNWDNPYAVKVSSIEHAPTVYAVEVVRCKECRFAKPYERMDGKTGYYCQFCGHSFKYGTNWERLYNPIKESDDFCSYGERKDGDD